MDPISQRAKEIFVSLVDDISEEERDRRADEACQGDEVLRQRVRDLLLAHAEPDSRLDRLALDLSPTIENFDSTTEKAGSVIGNRLHSIGRR